MDHQTKETVFITGGSSGIGEALARAFHGRGAKVIISGRNLKALWHVAAECPGMETRVLDVSDAAAVERCAAEMDREHPALNMVINNAGIQRLVDFANDAAPPLEDLTAEIDTNLKGLLYVTRAFLPALRRQPAARLVQVSSALAYVPLVQAPVYSATKAAVHAFTIALREQLRGSSVRVIELLPPLVVTQLHRGQGDVPQHAMPLDLFTLEAMRALDSGREELPIGKAKFLRMGSRIAPGRFLKILNRLE